MNMYPKKHVQRPLEVVQSWSIFSTIIKLLRTVTSKIFEYNIVYMSRSGRFFNLLKAAGTASFPEVIQRQKITYVLVSEFRGTICFRENALYSVDPQHYCSNLREDTNKTT